MSPYRKLFYFVYSRFIPTVYFYHRLSHPRRKLRDTNYEVIIANILKQLFINGPAKVTLLYLIESIIKIHEHPIQQRSIKIGSVV